MESKINLKRELAYILGDLGKAELILGICGARQNTSRELRIFFRDLGRSILLLSRPLNTLSIEKKSYFKLILKISMQNF